MLNLQFETTRQGAKYIESEIKNLIYRKLCPVGVPYGTDGNGHVVQ